MKKFLCVFCSLMIIVFISGCNNAVENDVDDNIDDTSFSEQATEDNSINIFNDEDSITVVSGNLSYSIPGSIQEQYKEYLKDVGFSTLVFQTYDISEFGKLKIYQANSFYDEETWNLINDLALSSINFANTRADLNIFDKDKRYTFSSFNGIDVGTGIDLYMYTDDDDVKILSSQGLEEETGETRFIYMTKGLSSYAIEFDFELGKYDKQIIDTFLGSIEFVSLEDF